ncbi:MAG: hypothetical protein JNJ90_19760 [Saprospiraceae bacterium]|jgi:hypothetical protein|nr:hypothetical protein [Saprospiraceae bacterium]
MLFYIRIMVPHPNARFIQAAFIVFAACALTACQAPPQPVQPAFFHWKNRLAPTPTEIFLLDSLNCRTLYVKFLDIARDADGTIRPYSLLTVDDTAGLAGRTIVPCVFITNNVFQHISEEKLDWLAQKTATAIIKITEQFPPSTNLPVNQSTSQPVNQSTEIQFDCDWTDATRAAFFSFLKKIRRLLPSGTRLSATIRLHQYKFPDRTGVPPVDRGLLMLYNTGDIHDPDEPNSIFQPAAAEKYLHGAPPEYPLPLDVALPAYSWALIYRDGELWKIVPNVEPPQNSTPKTQHSKLPNLLPDDHVRYETVDTNLLRQAATLAAGIRLARDARVAFFHLDTSTVRRYPAGFLKSLCETIDSRR